MTQEAQHIFQRLRDGTVPNKGLEHFAVGIEKQRKELQRIMEMGMQNEGIFKFLRGGYGCGKTFMARMAILDAQNKNYVTSFVVVSENDLQFHKFEDVYSKVMQQLSTANCERAAFGDILNQWIVKIEDALIDIGEDEEADDFDDKVQAKLNSELHRLTAGKAPQDFVRVIQAIFRLKQEEKYSEAGALLSWLSGSKNVSAGAKKEAQIKGEITSRDAFSYLRGVLEIIKAVGYNGLLIVIDEAETILRMRSDVRHKALNGLRQTVDDAQNFPGLIWLLTGTKEFFDTRKGVAGLEPLHQRLKFIQQGSRVSLRQPQLELKPFDAERLKKVAVRLRSIYPSQQQARLQSLVSDTFIEQLVDSITKGFHGDVGVIPRQFLREFVNALDLTDENEDYNPTEEYKFDIAKSKDSFNTTEQAILDKKKLVEDDEDDDLIPVENAW